MITASHNPSSDNGLKLFSSKGAKFSLSEEARIEELLDENKGDLSATSEFKSVDIKKDYLEYICGFFQKTHCLAKGLFWIPQTVQPVRPPRKRSPD